MGSIKYYSPKITDVIEICTEEKNIEEWVCTKICKIVQGLQQIFIKGFLIDVFLLILFNYYKLLYVKKTQPVFFDNFILEFVRCSKI